MERSATDLDDSSARVMAIGLGILFLGKGEKCETALDAIKVIEHPIGRFLALTVETCAYFGTGSVLEVQKLLSLCGEHLEDDIKKNMHQVPSQHNKQNKQNKQYNISLMIDLNLNSNLNLNLI